MMPFIAKLYSTFLGRYYYKEFYLDVDIELYLLGDSVEMDKCDSLLSESLRLKRAERRMDRAVFFKKMQRNYLR